MPNILPICGHRPATTYTPQSDSIMLLPAAFRNYLALIKTREKGDSLEYTVFYYAYSAMDILEKHLKKDFGAHIVTKGTLTYDIVFPSSKHFLIFMLKNAGQSQTT